MDASVLGTPQHIVGDESGYSWSDSVPRDSWHLTGKLKSSSTTKCLDSLIKLDYHILPGVPKRYMRAMEQLLSTPIDVPWMHALPREAFKIFFKCLVEEITRIFSGLSFAYYEEAWTAGSRVLTSLKTSFINEHIFNESLSSGSNNNTVLESFRPKRSGFTKPTIYDRFGTRTGRLTVSEGPNILVLKKELRKIIGSSFGQEGSICSLDFRALEARIVLDEAGKTAPHGDLYSSLAEELFNGTVQRDSVKTAVIAEMYGASRAVLRSRLEVPDDVLDRFVRTIHEHFGIEQLKERLKSEAISENIIRNKFGRPVRVSSGQDNLLVNSYAQSSGVDIAMLGFDDVLQRLGTEGIRPLFVLHDALILDVSKERLHDVQNIECATIPKYNFKFPLKFELF